MLVVAVLPLSMVSLCLLSITSIPSDTVMPAHRLMQLVPSLTSWRQTDTASAARHTDVHHLTKREYTKIAILMVSAQKMCFDKGDMVKFKINYTVQAQSTKLTLPSHSTFAMTIVRVVKTNLPPTE